MNWKWFLTLSVGLNLVLLLVLQSDRSVPSRPGASEPFDSSSNRPGFVRSPGKVWLEPDVDRIKKVSAKSGAVESDYYPTFIRKLRAAGVSEDTIATLVVAEVGDRRIGDSIALQRKWNRGELTQEEYQLQTRQLQQDQEVVLETLLGKDGYRQYQVDHDYQLRQLAQSGNFSQGTLEKYFDLRKANQASIRELADKFSSSEYGSPDYQEQYANLQKTFQDDLSKTLGADAARAIYAETDWQVQSLRRKMQAVKISDDEYAQLGQVLQNYQQEQQRLSAMQRRGDTSGQDLAPQYQALEQQRKDQLGALLGPDRYAEYEKQNDGTFQQMKQWGKPNGLVDAQVDYVYQVVKSWRTQQQEMQKQLQSQQIRREDYDAATQQLTAATKDVLQKFLGADRYERLKRSTGQVP